MKNITRFAAAAALAVVAAAGFAVASPQEAAAATVPTIDSIYVNRAASKSSKGGFDLPTAWSDRSDWNGPRVTTTVYTTSMRYVTQKATAHGSAPGPEIRLHPGTYKVRTVAVEGKRSTTRWQTVTIKVKTDATTMSKAEFNKVKKGMTKKQVRKIVGSKVKLSNSWAIERTDYRRYAQIDWTKKGRVKSKTWSPGMCY